VVWDYLCDADIKCGIGHYGVILLGLDDGAPLNEPAEMLSGGESSDTADRRLLVHAGLPGVCGEALPRWRRIPRLRDMVNQRRTTSH
jgi:hypothetical protein